MVISLKNGNERLRIIDSHRKCNFFSIEKMWDAMSQDITEFGGCSNGNSTVSNIFPILAICISNKVIVCEC